MSERHVTMCWPNYIDESTLSGGQWSASLPLSQLMSATTADVAESVGLDPANTQFDITLPRFRTIAVVALNNHNLSVSARCRVTMFRDTQAQNEIWNSGWQNAWPAIYSTAELNWEDSNFWSGRPYEEDRKDFTPLGWVFLDRLQVARRVRVEIDDPTNSDGAVRLGRCFLGNSWQPTYNASYGIQYGYDIGTEFETAGNANMTEYADVKTPKRTVSFSLDHLDADEGARRALALQRQQGLHGEVLYTEFLEITNPVAFSRAFIGRLSSADPLAHPYYATYTNSISIKEIL
ncbi:hypothetical protein [Halomonas halocynthiae]|uniref:hypothetical protein n=1 Tax=Halomonas halocynthiae TaxID=176290 RepID=UPI00054E01FF|nr:hypothetical protein [Halomonas halocynthiae]